MFQNSTISSRSSSNHSANSCGRNSSMPSLRMQSPISPKTSYNPLFRHSDALTSFDASHFIFQEHQKRDRKHRKHPILRRYNSHDSHTNFHEICVESTENTPNSTGSRSENKGTPEISPQSTGEKSSKQHHQEFDARDFLERFSLPRVVRVENGEPLLLYRCFDSFTKIQAKGYVGKKGKEKLDSNVLYFPEGYSGWFSLTNEKGEKCAVAHSSILQLVREQVCSFISLQPFTAYAGHSPDPSELSGKVQYLKTQVRSGQLFQLRAVFQHRDHIEAGRHSTKSSHVSRSARDKDLANRYAQLISQNNQEYYVPLTTKGEFYEIHSSMKAKLCFQGLLEKTGPLALDKDCLYKISHLLRRVALPVKVKLMAGPLPSGLPKDLSDTFILEKKIQEPLMVTCTLPAPLENTPHRISCINLNSGLKLSRSMLGFDSENRLFKSQRLQEALAFCHKNVEEWYREVRIAPNLQTSQAAQNHHLNKIEPSKHKRSHYRHYSEVDAQTNLNVEESDRQKQIITKEVIEKFPKSKKWYRHFIKLGSKSDYSGEKYLDNQGLEGPEKIKSIERYKDMSRLIEDRFGKKCYNPVKKSASFMFSTKPVNLEERPVDTKNCPALLKCQSLDTHLYTYDESKLENNQHKKQERRKSNISDNLSFDFQMCLLENDNRIIDNKQFLSIEGQSLSADNDFEESKPVGVQRLKKSKPDLIPTLPKDDTSYITDRLCSEFHVKTKVQKRSITKQHLLAERTRCSVRSVDIKTTNLSIFDTSNEYEGDRQIPNIKKSVVVAQVHEVSKGKTQKKVKVPDIDDIPYSQVADEIRDNKNKKRPDENIYAEICENTTDTCDNKKMCQCKRTANSEYCYVKLGSNGDSVTQSDSDEAIYNTLR
ncbi:hypothetical protein AMK59_4768 [Oryctes borbonicus]|uniref:Uncharacterized protein n=1 Tax=Oryctes borbonicus TaxID=1629725 RepID=A0A0T6B8S4_9SCAR|nr:hypothetical protein AMK59_4768 [Oryctes borbonicus]